MGGRRSGATVSLLQYLRPYLWTVLAGVLCSIGVAAIDIALPYLFGRHLIDGLFIAGGSARQLFYIGLAALAIVLVKGAVSYAQMYSMASVSQRVVRDLRSSLFDHVLKLPLGYVSRRGSGEVLSRATHDIGAIQSLISAGIGSLAQQAVTLAGILCFVLFIHWQVALVSLLVLPAAGLAIAAYGGRVRKMSGRLHERVADLTGILGETLSGFRVIKAFTMEGYRRRIFQEQNERGYRASMRSAKAMATVTPVVELIVVAGMVVVLWFGGLEVLAGRMTTGELTSFLIYLGMATQPISLLSRSFALVQQARAALERVFQMLEAQTEPEMESGAAALPKRVRGHIRFESVWFHYEPGRDVLKEIDLTAHPGETIALVGPSGAGKSSLVNLIPRFYDPTRGRILLDGVDIREAPLGELRRQIGLVPQDTVLFKASVVENILAGRNGFDLSDVEEAARLANAHDFVARMPKGYDTVLGSGGATLSGGQRQRLAIARALLGDPPILILDEATSNLDPESETLVRQALQRVRRGRTTLIIAHRASTVRQADRVIVLEAGRIVQEGSHLELMGQSGLYRRLFGELQANEAAHGRREAPAGRLAEGGSPAS